MYASPTPITLQRQSRARITTSAEIISTWKRACVPICIHNPSLYPHLVPHSNSNANQSRIRAGSKPLQLTLRFHANADLIASRRERGLLSSHILPPCATPMHINHYYRPRMLSNSASSVQKLPPQRIKLCNSGPKRRRGDTVTTRPWNIHLLLAPPRGISSCLLPSWLRAPSPLNSSSNSDACPRR